MHTEWLDGLSFWTLSEKLCFEWVIASEVSLMLTKMTFLISWNVWSWLIIRSSRLVTLIGFIYSINRLFVCSFIHFLFIRLYINSIVACVFVCLNLKALAKRAPAVVLFNVFIDHRTWRNNSKEYNVHLANKRIIDLLQVGLFVLYYT